MAELTVLVADDHPVVAELIAAVLERAGHTVVRAADGEEALAAAGEHEPDLVVLDLEMPKLDGWAVLAQLREAGDVPVLVLSADEDEATRARALREGADDYVVKPIRPLEFVERLESLVRP